MKVTATLAALSIGLASVGLAQAADLSRAQVVEQLQVAQSQGLVISNDLSNYPVQSTPSTLSRTEVVNALHLAQAQGQVKIGEQIHYPNIQAKGPSETRTQVLAELNTARADGSLIIGESENYPL
ncbi:MAG: DUF4148 domain-containing protein [Castellaniella sp.]|uniref:DUF4148 domain-containing protein n=1 Tax=Castellaniella sp. TaxID=1955812 RepID=UPI003A859BC6